MKRSRRTAAAVFVLSLVGPLAARAADVRVWTARAIATVLAEVGPRFERTTGHRLHVSSGLPADFDRRLQAGDSFDVFFSVAAPVDRWIQEGRLRKKTRTDLARSGVGVGVRQGARKPDLRSVEAFKRALLDAKSIAYLRVGSGLHLAGVLERLAIAEPLAAKTTRPETDIACELVARGEVELCVVVITQILTTPGVELAGPLPLEIQSSIVFTGAVGTHAKAPDAARQLIDFLRHDLVVPVLRAQGMEPAP
jgi:molybdate transport system substrate-binding protein